jgi:hypothetical protein
LATRASVEYTFVAVRGNYARKCELRGRDCTPSRPTSNQEAALHFDLIFCRRPDCSLRYWALPTLCTPKMVIIKKPQKSKKCQAR